MARNNNTPEPGIYVALEGFAASTLDGVPITIVQGARLSGSHEFVQRFGCFFYRDGLEDIEVSRARAALHSGA
jgi:hypothetical protein